MNYYDLYKPKWQDQYNPVRKAQIEANHSILATLQQIDNNRDKKKDTTKDSTTSSTETSSKSPGWGSLTGLASPYTIDSNSYDAQEQNSNLTLDDRHRIFYNFFRDKGYNNNAIAALASIIQYESGFDHNARNEEERKRYGDNVAGVGLIQWSNERNAGTVPTTFEGQLERIHNDIQSRPHLASYIQQDNTIDNNVNQFIRGLLWGSNTSFTPIQSIETTYNKAYQNLGYNKKYSFKDTVNRNSKYAEDFLKKIIG